MRRAPFVDLPPRSAGATAAGVCVYGFTGDIDACHCPEKCCAQPLAIWNIGN